MISYTLSDNTPAVRSRQSQNTKTGMYRMGKDVLKGAGKRTPRKTGNLRRLTQVKQLSGNQVQVRWSARYAATQNAGKRRGAKPFRRYTTAGTGAGFVDVGISYVKSRVRSYFK